LRAACATSRWQMAVEKQQQVYQAEAQPHVYTRPPFSRGSLGVGLTVFTALQLCLDCCYDALHILWVLLPCQHRHTVFTVLYLWPCIPSSTSYAYICVHCVVLMALHSFINELCVYLTPAVLPLMHCPAGGSKTAKLRAGCARERVPCSPHTRVRQVTACR
jgi:hypothetical protein